MLSLLSIHPNLAPIFSAYTDEGMALIAVVSDSTNFVHFWTRLAVSEEHADLNASCPHAQSLRLLALCTRSHISTFMSLKQNEKCRQTTFQSTID